MWSMAGVGIGCVGAVGSGGTACVVAGGVATFDDPQAASANSASTKTAAARSCRCHVGGTALKAELTKRDREICEAIGPSLKRRGLIFVGIDVIGDYLTEINVTSPTGLQQINRFDNVRLEERIWDAIESRFKERHVLRAV